MRPAELHTGSPKAVADVRLALSPMTAFVDPSGSGKPAMLCALGHLFNGSGPEEADFEKDGPVTVAVTPEGIQGWIGLMSAVPVVALLWAFCSRAPA